MSFDKFGDVIVYQQVSNRPESFCNFLKGIIPESRDNIKLIYRHYAILFFAVDKQENNFCILDLM